MSLIERAMNKLSGEPEPEDHEKPEARRESADVPAGDEASAAHGAEAENGADAGVVADTATAAPEAAPAAVADAPRDAGAETPQRGAGYRRRSAPLEEEPRIIDATVATQLEPDAAGRSSARVQIDQERLAAAGFLTQNQTMTREAEEFQRIKRRLLGNIVPGMYQSERPPNLILVTSSVPGEGKTFISVNLAMSIAMEIDRTVLAIDTDIVKRDMSKVFGVVNRPGLFDLLAEPGMDLGDLLVRTNIANLSILPAGRRRPNSTEMLASGRMRELTDEIAMRYADRVVVFDSPPVLAMTTATALAPLVGQLVVVVEAGSTKHETVRETIQRLDNVRITGVVLNKSKQARESGYDYYGTYHQVQ